MIASTRSLHRARSLGIVLRHRLQAQRRQGSRVLIANLVELPVRTGTPGRTSSVAEVRDCADDMRVCIGRQIIRQWAASAVLLTTVSGLLCRHGAAAYADATGHRDVNCHRERGFGGLLRSRPSTVSSAGPSSR